LEFELLYKIDSGFSQNYKYQQLKKSEEQIFFFGFCIVLKEYENA
jgi:hypothetical protein